MSNFVHLHVHSEYSLLDGACRIKDMVNRAKELGQTSIAITDHGVMYGALEFYKQAKKEGIKPIIGCEVYVAPESRFDKIHRADSQYYHLVLLAENETGYKNLIKLVSQGFTEGFYTKPRIDEEILFENHEGIIALSACIAGKLPQLILKGELDGAKEMAMTYQKVFGADHFFLELQDHGIAEQKIVNTQIFKIAKETGIPMVATNDAHYIRREDAKLHDVLMCIQMNKTMEDHDRFGFETDEFYLKNADEMKKLFGDIDGAIENTQKIADLCNYDFILGKIHLPVFKVPGGQDSFSYLCRLCEEGFSARYGENEELKQRMDYELEIIQKMGYVDYFLIVQDFISYARNQDIPVGPGRGSAAGSIVSYCLYITNVDPVKYNLLFERFLNPERVSMPDIDIDFCYERRQEVIDYVVHKYGDDHVAQIITFGTMAARAAIRDVGRALAVSYAEVDKVAKLVPMEPGMTIENALKKSSDLRQLYGNDPKVKELIDTALAAEGMPRHASTHAAGVVITNHPVTDYVPLAKNDEAVVTQFPMTNIEELGLLKMDFLGLRTLTVIDQAQRLIRLKDKAFDIEKINFSEKKVYEMISNGLTDGVFQLESSGMKNVLQNIGPQNLEDIIAVISLYRPGPMDSIPRYTKNKNDPKNITYKDPMLEDILNVTYGCIVYQEQVMQIVCKLGGYSFGRADLVRRAMAKKKIDVMKQEKDHFINGMTDSDGNVIVEGAIKRGVSERAAQEIFDEMMDFARYAFNKSHAAAYAVIAYETAYLKCLYPKEFMAALLTSVLDNTPKIAEYIGECHKMGIKVLPPDINESDGVFTVSGNNIRFSLVAIKNIGRGFIQALMEERKKGGDFKDFYDFCSRMKENDLNKRAIEGLIKCGAFDSLGLRRSSLLQGYAKILESITREEKQNLSGQMGLFGVDEPDSKVSQVSLPDVEEFSLNEKLTMEKEAIGVYISGHPVSEYQNLINQVGAVLSVNILQAFSDQFDNPNTPSFFDGQNVVYIGIVSAKKIKTTKNNAEMAFLSIEDMFGFLDVLVFPKIYETSKSLLNIGEIVVVKGRISIREEKEPTIVAAEVMSVDDAKSIPATQKFNAKMYIRFSKFDGELWDEAKKILEKYPGDMQVYVYDDAVKKTSITDKRFWVKKCDGLMRELFSLMGEENIKLA